MKRLVVMRRVALPSMERLSVMLLSSSASVGSVLWKRMAMWSLDPKSRSCLKTWTNVKTWFTCSKTLFWTRTVCVVSVGRSMQHSVCCFWWVLHATVLVTSKKLHEQLNILFYTWPIFESAYFQRSWCPEGLKRALEKSNFTDFQLSYMQEELKKRVHHKVTKEQEKKVTVKCGWYTEKQMKEILKMSKLDSHLLQLSHCAW